MADLLTYRVVSQVSWGLKHLSPDRLPANDSAQPDSASSRPSSSVSP